MHPAPPNVSGYLILNEFPDSCENGGCYKAVDSIKNEHEVAGRLQLAVQAQVPRDSNLHKVFVAMTTAAPLDIPALYDPLFYKRRR